MINKKIVGIYADKDSLHYVSVIKRISGYILKPPMHGHSSHDIKRGNGHTLLRTFLAELPVDSSMSIYLALPRSEVFVRAVILPVMPVEDAIMSIKNSLAIYSHLDPDNIYYDVIISERNGGAFHALLVYAAKDDIEKYRKIFKETGHSASLKGIFPLSYGVSALLDDGTEPHGVLFSLEQEDVVEIFARSGRTLIFSMSCFVDAKDDKIMLLNAARDQFPQCKDMVNDLSSDSDMLEGSKKNRQRATLPPFKTNYASAALAPFVNRVQQISLDEQPVKINIIHPFRYIVPFLFVLIAVLYFITDNIKSRSVEASSELSQLVEQVKALENDLEPLQNKIDTLKKASRFKTDVQEFMRTRPELYTTINEIASLVPDGTWFANFTFNGSTITLRGTGTDALKTVEALRSSNLFDNVMLRGSVNRRPNGEENFTLVLELSQPEGGSEKESIEKSVDTATQKAQSVDSSSGGL
ncbi:MAG: PilN domain-containing protein [Desulfamplus sp.]|nr:PilN domain-containing protein [Desulfamplus sp.]